MEGQRSPAGEDPEKRPLRHFTVGGGRPKSFSSSPLSLLLLFWLFSLLSFLSSSSLSLPLCLRPTPHSLLGRDPYFSKEPCSPDPHQYTKAIEILSEIAAPALRTAPWRAGPWALGELVCSLAETRPGELAARRKALARLGAAEPGRRGGPAGGRAQGGPRGGRGAAAPACAPPGSQGPAAEGRGVLPGAAGPGRQRVGSAPPSAVNREGL